MLAWDLSLLSWIVTKALIDVRIARRLAAISRAHKPIYGRDMRIGPSGLPEARRRSSRG